MQSIVAISPMHHATEARYDPVDMARAITTLSRIVPLWDFSRTAGLISRAEFWLGFDNLHFSDTISRLMLRRIFLDSMPPGWEQFGQLQDHTKKRISAP